MKSSEIQRVKGYLNRILDDGGKRFQYRSSVRSLLGVRDRGEGKFASVPRLPPVGFRYANQGPLADQNVEQHNPTSDVHYSSYDSERTIEAYQDASFRDVDQGGVFFPETISRVDKRVQHDKEFLPKGIQSENSGGSCGNPSSSEQNRNSINGAEKLGNHIQFDSNGKIEIPGFSEKGNALPALTSGRDGQPSDNVNELNRENFSKSNLNRGISRKREGGSKVNSGPETANVLEKLEIEKESKQKLVFKPLVGVIDTPLTDRIGRIRDGVKAAETKKSEPTMIVQNREKEDREGEIENQSNASSDYYQYFATDVLSRTTVNEAQTIDQLRHSVRKLESKISSQQTNNNSGTKEQIAKQSRPVPTKQVVVVREISKHGRISHAFWERSYLGRYKLTILR